MNVWAMLLLKYTSSYHRVDLLVNPDILANKKQGNLTWPLNELFTEGECCVFHKVLGHFKGQKPVRSR